MLGEFTVTKFYGKIAQKIYKLMTHNVGQFIKSRVSTLYRERYVINFNSYNLMLHSQLYSKINLR